MPHMPTPSESPHDTPRPDAGEQIPAPGGGATRFVRIDAGGLADAQQSRGGPVSVWLSRESACPIRPGSGLPEIALCAHNAGRWTIDRIGPTPSAGPADPSLTVIDRRGSVLIPGLVNAHCHLDLTGIGPRPHEPGDGFVAWVRTIIEHRPTDPDAIRDAVAQGVRLSLAGGVVAVGDILGAALGAPTTTGLSVLAASPLAGVGYVEFFGIGARAEAAASALDNLVHELAAWPVGTRIRPGLHPHAPNTVSRPLFERAAEIAARDALPISTHLAETPEERTFIADAAGPQRELLERMGIWDERERAHIGHGPHPVAHLEPALARAPFLCAHVNDADDAGIGTLARTGASVVYCPRASAYFGAASHFGPHRFLDMLASGVPVCLGTDSIVNLDTPTRISPLDDARLLARTTDADARTLVAMMTTHGAIALGLDPDRFVFREGAPIAGINAVRVGGVETASTGPAATDLASAVLESEAPPELLCC